MGDIDKIEGSCPDEILKAGLGPDIDASCGSSAVTSKASFVSATLIAGAPAPMSGEDKF